MSDEIPENLPASPPPRESSDPALTADPPLATTPAAHRRPGLVAILYAYRAVAGLAVALPAAAALGAPTAHYPRAQAELFDAGGLMLLASLRLSRRALPAVGYAGGTITVLAAALGLFPLAMLIAGLGRSGRLGPAFLAARAWAHAGTLALLFGVGALAQALVAVVLAVLGAKIIAATRITPPAEDVAFGALLVVILAAVAAVGVARDLAYVAAVHGGHRFYVAAQRALRTLARSPGRTLFGWTWRAALGFGALALAAWAAPSPSGSGAVMVAFVLHQAALAGSAFARASWLAAAIRAVDPPVVDQR